MANIEVFYPSGRNLAAWETSYAAGSVPDKWPYGLNMVRSASDSSFEAIEAGPLKPTSLAKELLLQTLRNPRNKPSEDVAIAWDEDLALRLASERAETAKLSGVIWTTDRIVRREKNVKDVLLKRFLPQFEGLWALSRPQISVLQDWLGRTAPPIDFLRFGIDQNFFTPFPYPDKPLILSVGRDRDRDPKTLFAALEEIKRLRPDVEVAVQTTSSVPVPDGVTSVPMLPHAELRNYYRRASVVVVATQPNLHVSGMTVALESMATARPVVVCDTPGMSDYVEDGVTGLLVSPFDVKGLAGAVLSLLADRDAAARMGVCGRERIERLHTTEQMARSLRDIIRHRTC